jgi:ATP-dependent RNA helicase DHX36
MYSKADAEAICYYLAAKAMKMQDQRMWDDFVKYLHEHNGEILKPIMPIGVWLNVEAIGALRNRLSRLQELERELEAFSQKQKELSDEVDAERDEPQHFRHRPKLSDAQLKSKSKILLSRLKAYDVNSRLEALRKSRSELPLNHYAEEVKALFDKHDVCVLVGATGSGKTTQVPQLLFDQAIRDGRGAECNIICTQPRRIAATSVARRVAAERDESLKQSVGYHVRFGYNPPEWGGSITYCTTGVLLKQLEQGWSCLNGVTHILVDEVHERDVQIDFLMVLLKRILEARRQGDETAPKCKVILMSATIDTTLFRKYFGSGYDSGECPLIEIPGRMFPVEKFYLDDVLAMLSHVKRELGEDLITTQYLKKEREARFNVTAALEHEAEEEEESGIEWTKTGASWEEEDFSLREDAVNQPDALLAYTIAHLCTKKSDGAVLVFLPGMQEIVSLDKFMRSRTFFGEDFQDQSKYRLFMLHSSIPTMQSEVFNPTPPGVRKIILSTNIAETSVTIPEVTFVVDTCKHREKRYSQLRRSTALICTWVSQSSARQRLGRAGRVKAGEYYALIYPERHAALPVGDQAEIKRSDLQGVCLGVRSYGIKDPIADVLEECIEPPSSLAVVTALKTLQNLRALDDNENLTPLGVVLSQLYLPQSYVANPVPSNRRLAEWFYLVLSSNVSTQSSSLRQSNLLETSFSPLLDLTPAMLKSAMVWPWVSNPIT